MPGDMADSIAYAVADEGLLATDGPLPTLWTDAQNRSTPIVLLGTEHLVNAHRFAKAKGLRAGIVQALAQEIATRGLVLDADDLPTIPFEDTTPVWVDGQGGRHPIPQMDPAHLLNAHRFARRNLPDHAIVLAMATEITRRGLQPHPLTQADHVGPVDASDGGIADEHLLAIHRYAVQNGHPAVHTDSLMAALTERGLTPLPLNRVDGAASPDPLDDGLTF